MESFKLPNMSLHFQMSWLESVFELNITSIKMSTIESFSPFKIHQNLIFSFDIHRIIVQEQLRHTNSSVQFLQSFAKKKRKKILSSQYFIFPLPSKLSMCKFSLLFQPNITKKKNPYHISFLIPIYTGRLVWKLS